MIEIPALVGSIDCTILQGLGRSDLEARALFSQVDPAREIQARAMATLMPATVEAVSPFSKSLILATAHTCLLHVAEKLPVIHQAGPAI